MMANQVKTVVGKTLSSLGTFQVRTRAIAEPTCTFHQGQQLKLHK